MRIDRALIRGASIRMIRIIRIIRTEDGFQSRWKTSLRGIVTGLLSGFVSMMSFM